MECDTRPTVTNISSKKGESLKDMVVRTKIQKVNTRFHTNMDVWPVTQAGIFSQRHRWWPRISFLWGNQDDYMKTTNLKNYRFFWFSTSWGITAPKIFIYTNFRFGFCVTGHSELAANEDTL